MYFSTSNPFVEHQLRRTDHIYRYYGNNTINVHVPLYKKDCHFSNGSITVYWDLYTVTSSLNGHCLPWSTLCSEGHSTTYTSSDCDNIWYTFQDSYIFLISEFQDFSRFLPSHVFKTFFPISLELTASNSVMPRHSFFQKQSLYDWFFSWLVRPIKEK